MLAVSRGQVTNKTEDGDVRGKSSQITHSIRARLLKKKEKTQQNLGALGLQIMEGRREMWRCSGPISSLQRVLLQRREKCGRVISSEKE